MNNRLVLPVKKLGRIVLVLGLSGLLLLALGLLLQPAGSVRAWSIAQPAVKAAPTDSLRYVAVEGTDTDNDCSLSTNPCATVQRAVDVATPDDEIRVAAGTYTGVQVRQGITQVVYISQSVTIRGGYTTTNWTASDPETYATILDAQGQGRVVVILSASVTLEGLQLTGGDTQSFVDQSWPSITGRNGGGLYIEASLQAVISGCQVYSNVATYTGAGMYATSSGITVTHSHIFFNVVSTTGAAGGIYAAGGPVTIDDSYIYNNSAGWGGGLGLGNDTTQIQLRRNRIFDNHAYRWGGGLLVVSTLPDTDILIASNVFSQNVADYDGGGIFLANPSSLVTGNLFISNTAAEVGGGAYVYYGSDTLVQNTFISNTGSAGGGGVSIAYSPATLTENHFEHNHAWVGGAIQVWNSSIVTMTANVVVRNTALTGGGIAVDNDDGAGEIILTKNILAENTATDIDGRSGVAVYRVQSAILNNNVFLNHPGYALMVSGGYVTATHNTIVSNVGGIQLANFGPALELTLVNTILAKNGTALEAADGTTATLNGVLWFDNMIDTYGSGYITIGQQITADPLLAADGYHLLAGSPAIDAGVSSGVVDDIDGEPRPSGSVVDIGADEWLYPSTVDLSVTQQVLPVVANPYEAVTYTIAYRNAGGTATGVAISAEIPTGLMNLNVINSGAVLTSMPGMTYTWQVADLSFGAGGLITITATVMPGLAPQVLTSTVSITASQSDSNPENNVTSAMLTIANRAPVANVGPDQNALTSESITLDGSASFDLDGHLPLSYEWQQVGGVQIMLSSNTVSRPTFIAPGTPSILLFSLSVTDSVGLRSTMTATTVVTVTDRPVTNLRAVNDSPTTLGRATMFVATAEGSNINYTWNFGDGEIAAGQVTTHIYVLSGTYTTVVTASNGSGSVTATTPVTITNLAPFANAGPDQAVGINALMTLDGSASTDPDGHLPLSYEWQQISGGPVVLSSRVISRPTFMAPNVPAVLAFSLVVTDSKALRSPVIDTVVITVSDQPITALLAVNNSPTTLGQTTWFTATAAGSNISYTWNFGDGLVTLGNPISHTYAASGFYTALVTATNGVNSLTTTLPVTITNLVPVAIAGPDQNATVNAQVDLDGSHSYDQDGHLPLAYYWTQVGGPAVILSNAVISQLAFTALATPGVLTFTLCVTDAYGLASAVDTTVVHVNDQVITGLQASNSSPIKVGQAVTFTATLRTGSNVLYQWNFGDDTISEPTNLLTMTHVYSRYSSFTAIVTATNQSGIEIGDTLVVVQPYSIYIPLLRKDS